MVLLKVKEACALLRIGRSTLYNRFKPGAPGYDESFPRPNSCGGRSVFFLKDQLEAWIAGNLAQSNDAPPNETGPKANQTSNARGKSSRESLAFDASALTSTTTLKSAQDRKSVV